jgi:hypothetical protein
MGAYAGVVMANNRDRARLSIRRSWTSPPENGSETLDHKALAKFGIEFTQPTPGDRVEERCDAVRGKIMKRLPQGYSLWVVRIVADGWYPEREARINYYDNTWEARDVFVGHPHEAQWELGAYVVGPIGAAVIEHWQRYFTEYWKILNQLRAVPGHGTTPHRMGPIRSPAFGVVSCKTIKLGKKTTLREGPVEI